MTEKPAKVANILDAMHHPDLFGPHFEGGTWEAWQAFLAALFGLQMSADQRRIYRQCTARKSPPRGQYNEAWLCVGRRAGKSFIAAMIACYLTAIRNYHKHLKPGERATVMIIAADKDQAGVIMGYARALLESTPVLSARVQRQTATSVDLMGDVSIEVRAANFRSVRGRTIVACIADEISFWRSEDSANPDHEILAAIRPAMATIPNALLLCLSSPYRKAGALYEAHAKHYGVDKSKVLVWQAATEIMNPSIDKTIIRRAYVDDPVVAAAEYGAQFRDDISGLIDHETLAACLRPTAAPLPPQPGINYRGFVDPSGGRADAFTLAIGHREGETRVIDAIYAREGKLVPASVVSEFAAILKQYRISRVTGDAYAGAWPAQEFARHHISYERAGMAKSDLYVQGLPLLASGLASLPSDKKLVAEITRLERRTTRAGKDSVDHPRGGHDDRANSVFGLLSVLSANRLEPRIRKLFDDDGPLQPADSFTELAYGHNHVFRALGRD